MDSRRYGRRDIDVARSLYRVVVSVATRALAQVPAEWQLVFENLRANGLGPLGWTDEAQASARRFLELVDKPHTPRVRMRNRSISSLSLRAVSEAQAAWMKTIGSTTSSANERAAVSPAPSSSGATLGCTATLPVQSVFDLQLRMLRSAFGVAIAAAWLAGCVGDTLVPCGELLCASGQICTAGGCASPANAAACLGLTETEPCTSGTGEAGSCLGGSCRVPVCGNGTRELGEACDDSNQTSMDGCSADCQSLEVCGNDVVDTQVGEQCDSGVDGLSGDGCSSRCKDETNLWTAITPQDLPAVLYGAMAQAPSGRLLLFGGRPSLAATPGYDATWEWDGTTWSLLHPLTSPPGRVQHAMAYDSTRRRLVLFGGRDELNVSFGDTWEWDGVTWNHRFPSTSPPPRRQHAMTYDPVRGRVVLFGGSAGMGALGDTWEWDGDTWQQRVSATSPVAQVLAGLSYSPARQRIVMFGGANSETWEWDGTNWTGYTQATSPPPTPYAAIWFDAARVKTILAASDGLLWEWNGSWVSRAASPTMPSGGTGLRSSAYDPARARLVVAGGLTAQALADTYECDGVGWALAVPRQRPQRADALAFDARRGRVVAFDSSNTWEWDGAAWRPVAAFGYRLGVALAYDIARGVTVLFSGRGQPADTWTWDGMTWSQATPATSPPPRNDHSMAYDAVRERIVLFGGVDNGSGATRFGDTWEWDGTTWHDRTMSVSPSPRTRPSMAYDAARERIVLFGGGLGLGASNETWEWDGVQWLEHHPPVSPPRWLSSMAYDPLRRRVVLVNSGGDSWEWDGTTWARRNLLVPPPALTGSAVADVTGGILFAGHEALGSAQTWRLNYASSAAPPERCVSAGVDADGDGLEGCSDPDCWGRCTPLCPPGATCPATAPRCGDGSCAAVEDYLLCPADCPVP